VILEEYNMYQDTPMYQIGWDFEKMIFGDQPLGWDQVGTKELIKSITQQQFKDYFKALYTPANSVLVVAGKVPDHDEVVEQIEKLFKFKNVEKTLEMADFEGFTSEEKIVLRDKKTEQAHVMLGVPGYAEDDERSYAAKLLAIVMGGNMSSRLFLGVREAHGLAYYINCTTDEYIDAGTFSVSAGVSLERIDLAISSIVAELAKVARVGITVAELEKAKKYYSGKIKLRLEDSEEYAHLLGKYELLEGKYIEPAELLKKIEGVSLEQVNEAARDLLREEELRLCVIGPFADHARFEKLLKF
jgi:predicted Zn-dependent peptidase